MNWKATIFITLICFQISYSHHGIRMPPARLSRNSNGVTSIPTTTSAIPTIVPEISTKIINLSNEQQLQSVTDESTSNLASTHSPFSNRRIYTNSNVHKNMIKSNQSLAIPQKQLHHHNHQSNFEDTETLHMGVAEPLSSEDFDTDLNPKPIIASTQKDGISTWILLSGDGSGKNPKIVPTTETPTRTSIRYESKIERITKTRSSTTPKPKYKSTTVTVGTTKPKVEHIKLVELIDSNQSKPNNQQNNNQVRPKKNITTIKPEIVTKKHINKKVTAATVSSSKAPLSTVSTTSVPSTTPSAITATATTAESIVEPTSVESTTFLIMEPKDADFDLPQDRSPGTTKKPKKTKTKKNKTKTDPKKPIKTQIANKDKPLSTKIYNYLAREVMPTVGVGLVGLTVAAGLATYFLAPFGALRRSYDDAADRKDDMYYYNNEEYAGPDGQLEEEAFGKVIAGMPINSPYRNTIRYTVQQQPSQSQQLRQPNQISRPGAKYVHYPAAGSPQYRVRNVAPAGYPSVVQQQQPQQYNSYQQQNQQSNPVYTKRRDQYPQQFYRYSDEPSVGMYRKNSNFEALQQQQQQQPHQQQQQQVQNAPPTQIDAHKSDEKTYDSIVTAEPYFDNTMPGGSDIKNLDENVLSKRTQFVVGTTVDDEKQQQSSPSANEEDVKETVDVIPEHGPRKRRHIRKRRQNLRENEIDSVITNNKVLSENEIEASVEPQKEITLQTENNIINVTTEQSKNPEVTTTPKAPLRPNIVDLIKDLFEVKVRMGLSFLQRTTMTVQKYLQNVEKRVIESNIFQNKNKSNKK